MSNKKMVNIRVNPELWHQAKVEAVKQGVSLQEWLDKAIASQLRKDRIPAAPESATGIYTPQGDKLELQK